MNGRRLGIIVGGGPAPGINAVIGAATIEAVNRGFEVYGFYDGFQWLVSEDFTPARHSVRLEISNVARIHFEGGSMLRTSRTSLLQVEKAALDKPVEPNLKRIDTVLTNLAKLGITHLLTIGGDDTALSARFVCDAAERRIRLVHVPKTIDNDLPLPHDIPTFGFSTARYIGTALVKNLMRDSQTTGRWYFIKTMGRSAGWLASTIGLSVGATITLIPEEFPQRIKLRYVLDVLEGAILKRRVLGRPDGVALLAEGLVYRLGDVQELEQVLGYPVEVDAVGNPKLADIDLEGMARNEIQARFRARGQKIDVVALDLGYELRSADPTPFDMGYCRALGYYSVWMLVNSNDAPPGRMVTIVNGNLEPVDLHELVDRSTNRTRIRQVDTRSDMYRVARAYQIRLERSDLENPDMLKRLSDEAALPPDEFYKRYLRAATRLVDGLPDFDE
jgi:6-phosphofructokinase 1